MDHNHAALSYAWEKAYVAVRILATHPGRIQSRLRGAYEDSFSRIDGDVLTGEAKRYFNEIVSQIVIEGDVSTFHLSDDEGMMIADKIVALYCELRSIVHPT